MVSIITKGYQLIFEGFFLLLNNALVRQPVGQECLIIREQGVILSMSDQRMISECITLYDSVYIPQMTLASLHQAMCLLFLEVHDTNFNYSLHHVYHLLFCIYIYSAFCILRAFPLPWEVYLFCILSAFPLAWESLFVLFVHIKIAQNTQTHTHTQRIIGTILLLIWNYK